MEEQILLPSPPGNKSKYWKFVAAFLVIIVLVVGGYFAWAKYLSPQARYARQTQENYQKYLNWQKNFEMAMKNDTYGGKTPEETLKMFIDALKKDDVELASKYFILDENGDIDPKWVKGLQDTKEAGKFQNLANLLSKAVPAKEDITSAEDFKFRVYEEGILKAYINMQLNKYSGVWKIESM